MLQGTRFGLGLDLGYRYRAGGGGGTPGNNGGGPPPPPNPGDTSVVGLTLDGGVVKRKYQGYFADDSTFFNSRRLNDNEYFTSQGYGDFQITNLGSYITDSQWYNDGFSLNQQYDLSPDIGTFPAVGSGLIFSGGSTSATGQERAAVSRPLTSETVSSIINDGYSAAAGDNNKSLIARGYFRPVVSGVYSFRITSDDASYLWLGAPALDYNRQISNAVVSNGGIHGPAPATGQFTMTANLYYALAIMFGNGPEGEGVLTFEYIPPGSAEYTTDLR